jgi:hypothetical protein
MTRSEQIRKLTETGELTQMYSNGIIGYKVLMYRDIYFQYDIELRLGVSRMQAIQNTADIFKISNRTIYRAINFFEDDN